jgi:hypothetical protein
VFQQGYGQSGSIALPASLGGIKCQIIFIAISTFTNQCAYSAT